MAPAPLTAATLTPEAATFLLNRWYDFTEATAPKARDVAASRLDGACGVLYAQGFGWTPTHVRSIVADACREAGPRPRGGAFPTERNAHLERVKAAILAGFAAID